jgi:predicted glycosyltransferase involved in capsule biosynthesis
MCQQDFARVLYRPQQHFNKSKAINWAARVSPCEYLLFTDVDYLFSPDLMEAAMIRAAKGRMLTKRVHLLPKGAVTDWRIDKWDFVSVTPFPYWPYSCGGFQLHHKDDFIKLGGYDERFNVGAMDWHYMIRFQNEVGATEEVKRGQILHQWHPITKDRWKADARRNEKTAMKELGITDFRI